MKEKIKQNIKPTTICLDWTKNEAKIKITNKLILNFLYEFGNKIIASNTIVSFLFNNWMSNKIEPSDIVNSPTNKK